MNKNKNSVRISRSTTPPWHTVLRAVLKSAIVLLGLLTTLFADEKPQSPSGPVAPRDSLKHFELAPGLSIEVVAHEPDVVDPVAIRFDEEFRMWVVEMRDYPHGPAKGEKPKSRIKILELTASGQYKLKSIFAEELLFVTGIQPWKGGVFVTMAGEVRYMKDTNGDGKADHSETWYKGFAQENTQLRANHPRLALDNHIYIANGLRGGAVVDARDPDSKPVSISGMDFRFDPLTRKFEAVSGVGQFGLTFDDWGNRFVCSNRNPLKQIVIENRYLQKNPLAAIRSVFHDVAIAGAESRVYPITRAWTTSNLHAGQFTAACGVEIFRGDGLPAAFRGNAFTCDPTGHLVHREIMKPAGATFAAKPARDGVEFLASRDQWFRPVNLLTGPDGALYVIDMYRAVIEHPQFMPTELKERPDLLLGNDRGRIYRISSRKQKALFNDAADANGHNSKLQRLAHSNGWVRDTVARRVLEKQDKSDAKKLRLLMEEWTNERANPAARLHALWLLRGLGADTEEDVVRGLKDKDPRVRRQAVLLAERWLEKNPKLLENLLAMTDDPDRGVQFQVALSIAPLPSANISVAGRMAYLMKGSVDDPWLRRAILIAAGDYASSFGWHFVMDPPLANTPGGRALFTDLFATAGKNRDGKKLIKVAELMAMDHGQDLSRTQRSAMTAFANSLLGQRKTLWSLVDQSSDESKASLKGQFARAAADAGSEKNSDEIRIEAIKMLAHDRDAAPLAKLATDANSQAVRIAAISALRQHALIDPWKVFVKRFPSETPAMRGPIIDGLLARGDRTTLLLDAIEDAKIKPGELDRTRTNRLLNHGNVDIKTRARKLLASAIPADRQKVLAEYQAVLKLKGDPLVGRQVFKTNCAQCHRIGELGVDVAPNISDSRTKQPVQYLTDILQPNRAIDANYIAYNVIAVDGRILTGVLSSETSTSITLRQPENKTVTLSRDQIEEMKSSGISLMPEGLEKKIPHQAMADLISFIKNWRYLDGKIPFRDD